MNGCELGTHVVAVCFRQLPCRFSLDKFVTAVVEPPPSVFQVASWSCKVKVSLVRKCYKTREAYGPFGLYNVVIRIRIVIVIAIVICSSY